MNNNDFTESVEAQMKRASQVLVKKAEEYASDEDRLHNFKVAAKLQGITVEQAVVGMMAKHVTSVFDMVMSGEDFPMEMWHEKIGDNLNYLILLQAAVEERKINVQAQLQDLRGSLSAPAHLDQP